LCPHGDIDRVTLLYRPIDSARAARIVKQDKRNADFRVNSSARALVEQRAAAATRGRSEYDMSWSAAARAEAPDHTNDVLEEIRQEISATDDDLKEARKRRDLVLKAPASFPGTLRTFSPGRSPTAT
jgi:hypothetical protein